MLADYGLKQCPMFSSDSLANKATGDTGKHKFVKLSRDSVFFLISHCKQCRTWAITVVKQT